MDCLKIELIGNYSIFASYLKKKKLRYVGTEKQGKLRNKLRFNNYYFL